MKITKLTYAALLVGSIGMATSCIDDKYDLDNINTSTAIKLNNLTVPVKLSEITLDDVLDVDMDDPDAIIQIKTDAAGNRYYAIVKGGYFSADPVFIGELEAVSEFSIPSFDIPGNGTIEDRTVPFSYLINNVDESLNYLSKFGLKESNLLQISLDVYPATASLNNVVIKIPDTFVAYYNGSTISNGNVAVNIVNGHLEYPLYITEMRFEPVLTPNDQRQIDIAGVIGLASATVSNPSGDVTLQFNMSPFTANVVSGSIEYHVDVPTIEPVELTDLPDFLTDGESQLILQNPQLYLDFTQLNGANYNTSLNIYPEGEGTSEIMIPDLVFQETLILAPDIYDLGMPAMYDSPVTVPAPQLMNILYGNGIPERINFEMGTTYLDGDVQNLELGVDKLLEGSYTFFSPLAFANGTKIIYSKTEDDFFGDDMEDVEVSLLELSTNVTTNLPFAVNLVVYPLDKDGKVLDQASGTVPANAKNSLLDIKFTKPFKGLDGMRFTVTADDMNGTSLTPEQYLLLENIRATVTGEYVTKL